MADASAVGESGLVGCTQVTEIKYTAGVRLLGLLPKEFELATVYAAAVCKRAVDRTVAESFVELLASDESTALRRAGGFVVE